MKKFFLLLSAVVVAALSGCQKSGISTVREGSPTVEGADVTGVTTNSAAARA